MSNPWTSPTIVNYNATPPPDDGTSGADNTVEWDKHKTKLSDPIKTALETTWTNINTAVGKVVGGGGVTATAVNYTVLASDQGKFVRATAGGITITTPDATSVTSPFVFIVVNDGGSDITLDGNGAQTVNGAANLTIGDQAGVVVGTDGSNWFAAGLPTAVVAASDTVAGIIEIATQAEMETGTDTTRAVTPGRVHNNPGVAKAWGDVD